MGQAGTSGVTGGRDGGGGTGGSGGSAGGGLGGSSGDSAVGGLGGSSGDSAVGGSGGISGTGEGGGSGSAQSGAGGNGGQDLPPVAWAPTGVFGDAVDEFVRARTKFTQALCCKAVCCDAMHLEEATSCVRTEYRTMVPQAGWLACASRLAETDADVGGFLADQAYCWLDCAARTRSDTCPDPVLETCICLEGSVRALETCASRGPLLRCPGEEDTLAAVCSDTAECENGIDELNCDPSAPAFRCWSGDTAPWRSLCDETPDCADGSDEMLCQGS